MPSFPRHILFGGAPTIAGRSRQRPCDTHHGPQCPRLRHGPYSRQRLCLSHDPKSLTAASTQESSTQDRNVNIRHASRREQCSKARFYVRTSNSGSLAMFAAIRRVRVLWSSCPMIWCSCYGTINSRLGGRCEKVALINKVYWCCLLGAQQIKITVILDHCRGGGIVTN